MRGETTTIVEERRPVPLFQHVMVGRRLHDLFARSDVDASAGFVKEGAPVNGELLRVARDDWASTRLMRDRRSPRKGKPGSSKNPRNSFRKCRSTRDFADILDRAEREGWAVVCLDRVLLGRRLLGHRERPLPRVPARHARSASSATGPAAAVPVAAPVAAPPAVAASLAGTPPGPEAVSTAAVPVPRMRRTTAVVECSET